MIPFFERSYDWSVETSAKMQGIEPPSISSFQSLKANVQTQNGKYYIGGYVAGQVGTYAAASKVVKGIPFVGKAIGNAAERLSHLPILNHIGAGHLQNILGGLAVDVVVDTAPETVDDFLEGESAKDIAANTSLNVLENLGWNIVGEGVITGLGKAAEYVGGKWALKGVEGGSGTDRAINGQRTSRYRVLTPEEIESLQLDIEALGADPKLFRFNQGYQTGYSDGKGLIYVKGDVLPDLASTHPRDLMSQRAVLAHEYYGHKYYGDMYGIKNPAPGAWNDEFRASYSAALNAPNLTDMDRMYLMMDALERAKEAGVNIKMTDTMRRILYGY